MTAHFLLIPEAVATLGADTKQTILDEVAARLARAYALDCGVIRERIGLREEIGSTGFGRGVAIPHARIPGLSRPVAAFFRLASPVEFDAADAMPVDLVFALLSPEAAGASHLHALAAISRMMRDERMHEALSRAPDAEALYALLCNVDDRDAA